MTTAWWTNEGELLNGAERAPQTAHPPPSLMSAALQQWLAESQKPMSLLGARTCVDDATRWQRETREYVLRQLHFPAHHGDPAAEVRSRVEHPDYTREEIVFTTTPPLRVPATVLIPRGRGAGPFPAIVALHEMGGFRLFGREKMLAFDGEPACLSDARRTCYEGRSLLAESARRGYLTICIDAMNFGERTQSAVDDPVKFDAWRRGVSNEESRAFSLRVAHEEEPFNVQHLLSIGRCWPGLIFHDDRRTVDYLLTRRDVDPNRIGCLGLSFGAYRANYLAALDERIRAAVTVCWTSMIDAVIGFNRYALNWFASAPGIFAMMDLPDLLALSAPRALMVMSTWRDGLMRPSGITRAHFYLRECFDKFGCPQQLGSLVYDAPHEFNLAMQRDTFAWLDEKFGTTKT